MRQRPFCVRCRQRGDSGAELVVTGFGFILFLDAGGCTSLCGNWFVRPYIESRYFADHNMLGSATTKIRLPHRLVYPPTFSAFENFPPIFHFSAPFVLKNLQIPFPPTLFFYIPYKSPGAVGLR